MKLERLSPSAYSKFSFCEMQYFFSYGLYYREPTKKRTEFGTVVHKVMECLAIMKKNFQETGIYFVEDEVVGKIECSPEDWLRPKKLSMLEVASINKIRGNPYTYKSMCRVNNGHTVLGEALVKKLIDLAYNYYKTQHHETWNNSDYDDVTNWVWMVLEYKDGIYDPRRLTIVQTEHDFLIPIEKEWAKFDTIDENGNPITKHLEIRGVIDLIVEEEPGTIEIIDWKSGARKDWGTGEIKDYEYLRQDLQLLTYYYAARKMYPDKHVGITIFFIRDGGPFTFWHDEEALDIVEEKIKKRYEEITACQLPNMCDPLQKDDKCRKFCSFYKEKSPDGKLKNLCQFMHEQIKVIGMDEVITKYKKEKV